MTDPRAQFGGRIGRTVGESTPWWPTPVRPDPGSPNVVLVLLDDMGFSDVGPFGSEIPTPAIDRLAAGGIRFTNYHTAPLCSPSRAAIQTGMNPHRAGFAGVANFDPGFPGWTMEISPDIATLPEVLRSAGYATYAVGKWHLTRDAAMHDAADRSSWPVQRGFDRFYGILEGWTNLHHPHRLIRDNSQVDVDAYPEGYYFTDDITDEAISYLKSLRAHDAERPFFLYMAHGAVHGPLQAKADDIARHRGRYDRGWDEIRRERFERQKKLGIFPPTTAMPGRNSEPGHEVLPWDDYSEEEQSLFARYMEVYAAMVDNVDQNLARLLDVIEALGDRDNTVVIFTSDNGGTEEGGPTGTRSYYKHFGGFSARTGWKSDVPREPELIGGPRALVHYPRGWGMASNTPFRLYKSSTHAGGVRVPMIVSWPRGIPAGHNGEIRTQYQYVTDLFPTILDLTGVATPDGRDGFSFAQATTGGSGASTHPDQYSECFGNRSFYSNGWKLVALHRRGAPYDDTEWELYDLSRDPTETVDLAAERPEKVKELAEAWERSAHENLVFPLDDGTGLLQLLRRPDDEAFYKELRILPGTPTLERYRSQKLVALRDFEIEVEMVHRQGDCGVLLAHGDQGGGYSLYVDDGVLTFAYNQYGVMRFIDGGRLAAGARSVAISTKAGAGFTWDFEIVVDGAVTGALQGCEMLIGFAPFQGIDVGIDRRSPVVWSVFEKHGPFPYTGNLIAVTYRPGAPAPYDPQRLVEAMRSAGRRGQ
ncbi:MAG TPA: arylsulfatase [Acidimicrobiales bacterium]|nr:arylsulfatase [Acidimicrobiales bacterium]